MLLVYGKFSTLDQLKAPNLGLKALQKTSAAVKLKFVVQMVPQ
jgi:hypothetical protein